MAKIGEDASWRKMLGEDIGANARVERVECYSEVGSRVRVIVFASPTQSGEADTSGQIYRLKHPTVFFTKHTRACATFFPRLGQ